ncbi:MAG: nitroreductase family deazaflavin-dependent oxidoreductase [Thaumarchaeota archaeon]|nr:nitroreductase family deazaflavin-dependent oxidoreductase [Nitrososphaerota archaeon]
MSANDWNSGIITEFRKNHGKVGGHFEGAPLLLLHTKGARGGKTHVVPVMYLLDGNRYLIFASKAGAPTHPDWYHNLKANPNVKAEIGDKTIDLVAEEVTGHERDRLYKVQSTHFPSFADYETKTTRKIPVIALKTK